MNILILSVGTRNKIVEYFKKTLKKLGRNGKVIATDMSSYAPGLYEADNFYLVPSIKDEKYVDIIIDICKIEKIDGILSLIDPELELLAENEERFNKIGVKVVGSSKELCELSLDKMKMHDQLIARGYKTQRSYISLEDFLSDYEKELIDFPVFVKPIKGSASISINKVNDLKSLKFIFDHGENLMIQEFLDGQEIGADVYIDLISGKVVSIFLKKKLLMRAGETDKAVSFKDEDLFDLIVRFTEEFGYKGQIDIDIFDIDGKFYISEVNPRFGGGYPHAYECGLDHMELIFNNLDNIENKVNIGNYEDDIYMMKYNEVMVRKIYEK